MEHPKLGLDPNLGRLPIAAINGKTIGQSAAINFYFASEFGLMGKGNFEAAQVVALSEHLRECVEAYKVLVPTGQAATKRELDLWFEGGATDTEGHALDECKSKRYLTWWMGRIEHTVGAHGFAVGTQLSLADLLLYNTFAETETLRDECCAEGGGLWRRGPMGDQARMDGMLTKHPKIKTCCCTVARNTNIQKLLSIQGMASE